MVINIADELFPDVLEKLKYSWIGLISYHRQDDAQFPAVLMAVLRLIFDVVLNVCLVGLQAGIAASLGLINVVGWVAVVFSTAAPMILSGLYEASIDRQVLHALERKVRPFKVAHVRDREKPVHERTVPANDVRKINYQVHMLYAVLVGNLELWKPVEGKDVEKATGKSSPELSVAWDHVHRLVKTLDSGTTPQAKEAERKATETRLQTMLQCQASFGATIGAPIAFFLGSFLFSVFSNYETVGDNDTSHAMAFGEWWYDPKFPFSRNSTKTSVLSRLRVMIYLRALSVPS